MLTDRAIDLLEQWKDLCLDPKFQDILYKVELNQNGQVIMSPANNRHAYLQGVVSDLLRQLTEGGGVFPEFALLTDDGIRAPDVVWCSDAWIARNRDEAVATTAPEICVEIMSESNTLPEMEHKRGLYLDRGCEEFILVDVKGFVSFHNRDGALTESAAAAGFPRQVNLP